MATPAELIMTESFTYDVLLRHSLKDKAVVRPLAERLRVTRRFSIRCGACPSPISLSPRRGFDELVGRGPSDESLGYCR
jgi:hypothetical protein